MGNLRVTVKSKKALGAAPIKTKADLLARLKGLGRLSKEQRNSVVCSLIGHSRIQSAFFGYFNCGRCGEQVGDTLGSTYAGASKAVVIGHNCATCRENFKECTWKDTLYAAKPFEVKS